MSVGVCLVLAAALKATPVFLPVQSFTLAWTHSIEKIRWEEDYSVVARPDASARALLVATRARIHGSGAGMEPPPDAVLRDGWYVYTPHTAPLHELRLTRSPYTADYDWCTNGHCQPLSALLPSDGSVTLLRPCVDP